MTANELRLDILGTSFSITADEDKNYLDEIYNQYKAAVENTQNISGITDPLKTAILTGFLLCDEVNKMRLRSGETEAQRQVEEQEVEARTLNLISKIEQAMENMEP